MTCTIILALDAVTPAQILRGVYLSIRSWSLFSAKWFFVGSFLLVRLWPKQNGKKDRHKNADNSEPESLFHYVISQ